MSNVWMSLVTHIKESRHVVEHTRTHPVGKRLDTYERRGRDIHMDRREIHWDARRHTMNECCQTYE